MADVWQMAKDIFGQIVYNELSTGTGRLNVFVVMVITIVVLIQPPFLWLFRLITALVCRFWKIRGVAPKEIFPERKARDIVIIMCAFTWSVLLAGIMFSLQAQKAGTTVRDGGARAVARPR